MEYNNNNKNENLSHSNDMRGDIAPARGASRRRFSHSTGPQIYVPYIISVTVFHARRRYAITGMGRHSARAV